MLPGLTYAFSALVLRVSLLREWSQHVVVNRLAPADSISMSAALQALRLALRIVRFYLSITD